MTRTWAVGDCWRCEAIGVLVLWLGPVQTDSGTGPFVACEECVRRLEALVRQHAARPVQVC